MLEVCEDYAVDHNLIFSTDPNPKKSKSKCILMNGSNRDVLPENLPVPLQLNKKDLPWVVSATHLGHELSQDGSMKIDMKFKRANFIDKSIEIRETFGFADPVQILEAINTYCGDHYGTMIWDLYSEGAGQYFRCWNTAVKLVWNVPRSTHTYFVTCQLAANFESIRTKLLSRYVKFFQSLLKSKSPEVALVANLAGRDMGSTTGSNLSKLAQETGLNPWISSSSITRQTLDKLKVTVPNEDYWRLPLLEKLLMQRYKMEMQVQDTEAIQDLIDSLCSS